MDKNGPPENSGLPRPGFEDANRLAELRRQAQERLAREEREAGRPPSPPQDDRWQQNVTVYGLPPVGPGGRAMRPPAPVYGGPPMPPSMSEQRPPAPVYGGPPAPVYGGPPLPVKSQTGLIVALAVGFALLMILAVYFLQQ